jgi:hypothetical protein
MNHPAVQAAVECGETCDESFGEARAVVLGGQEVRDLNGNRAADALARSRAAVLAAEVAQLELVAHWADLHDGDAPDPLDWPDGSGRVLPGSERSVRPGGDGTPRVREFAAVELGVLLEITTTAAQALIRDVLDLRHRHPALWAGVLSGRARFWQARQIARMAHAAGLDRAGARHLDARTSPHLGLVPWGRLLTLAEAAVIEADPQAAEDRRVAKATEQFLRTGQSTEHGTKTLYARVQAGDAIRFLAICDHIAHLLTQRGDDQPLEVLRANAIGWLATPCAPPPSSNRPTTTTRPRTRPVTRTTEQGRQQTSQQTSPRS